MSTNFEDRVRASARKLKKEHKGLKLFISIYVSVCISIYRFFRYFGNNAKRYVLICTSVIFFFMSSSFSFPEEGDDSAIYLANQAEAGTLSSSDMIVNDQNSEELADMDNQSWIEDSELISEELEKELSSTDNVDTFTLDDFLKQEEIATAVIDSEESAFDKDAWNLILVNKTHPVPDDYDVPLTTISGSMRCDERVLEPLTQMLAAAKKQGVSLIVTSPYRDYQLQERLFNRKINAYMERGYSYMAAYKMTCSNVTVPGASEHQIGMAFDFVTNGHTTLDYEFANTQAGKWLYAHAEEYGFILRYPKDKTEITGIMYEPWHFRYVGVEAATYIMDNNLTLEEFVDSLE